MNLETCLYELNLLMTYGIEALKASSVPNAEDMRGWGIDDLVSYFNLYSGDIVEYLRDCGESLVFDGFDSCLEYVWDNLEKSDLLDYLNNNYDVEDLTEQCWRSW